MGAATQVRIFIHSYNASMNIFDISYVLLSANAVECRVFS